MPAAEDSQRPSVGAVERGLQRLDIAARGSSVRDGAGSASDADGGDGVTGDQPNSRSGVALQPLEDTIHMVDVDPLSVDLPKAILHLISLLDNGSIQPPQVAKGIVKKLRKWANAPKDKAVADALNGISALLLAEGVDFDASNVEEDTSGTVGWTDGKFTITVAMVFRPILVDLVARWTLPEAPAVVFHHLSPHMESERAHLCVAYASGILLGTSPQIKSLVMSYFQRCSSGSVVQHALAAQNMDIIRQSLVVAFRLLRRLPEVTSGIDSWDWATPLTMLMGSSDDGSVRLIACECLCLAKSLSDQGRARLIESLGVDTGLVARTLAYLVHGEELFDKAAADQMVAQNRTNLDEQLWQRMPSDSHPWVSDSLLSTCVANVGGVLLHSQESAQMSADLVLTPMVTKNIHEIALATSRSEPVLLQGPIGSGKTSLVEWVAKRTGNELVTIHLSNNMDAKVLLGNYVTTQKAGDFEWRAGLLTTAVAEGKWVLIEDIDLAPSDVIQTLVPLLESHTLFVASRGENIPAHIQFRLFATLSTHGRSSLRTGMDGLLGSSIWTRLEISSLESEMPQIIAGVFPNLAAHAELLAQSFSQVADIIGGPSAGMSLVRRSAQALSMSDLIKWCTRLSKFYDNDSFLLFQEAVDTFTLKESDYDKWRALVHRIGTVFGISKQRADLFIDQHSPIVSTTGRMLKVGRATLDIDGTASSDRMPFADTHHSRCLLERIATCVQLSEPTLLSGETGTGKTTVVQHLATLAGRSLSVFNLSQQSDSSDLLGGFRPVDISLIALRLRETFDKLFGRTVSVRKNAVFLDKVRVAHGRKDWKRLASLYQAAIKMAALVIQKARDAAESADRDGGDEGGQSAPKKRPRLSAESVDDLAGEWAAFQSSVEDFEGLKGAKMVFSFVEGALVKAARTGGWILLDEINLATAETLACLGGLLQKERSLLLAETGARIPCHPGFRLFACMNPSNDVGKRDLPPGLRSSFTEFFVHPPDNNNDDLLSIIRTHLPANVPPAICHRVIEFYRAGKRLAADHKLVDGANQKPHYSLRTLTRSLTYARENAQAYSLKRALYDGLYMTFVTQLESTTQALLISELHRVFAGDSLKQMLSQVPPCRSPDTVLVQSFWLPTLGEDACEDDGGYVVTSSVETKIKSLARAVMCGHYPVLIQGPTSAGKTSMVQYLARKTGHKFVRINNHEHTDLQEYLGSYTSVDGRLVFEEGLLVKALRHGHWLVLDELNLAPSDVLEALNRLLDDNRELVIPETQEVVRPHPHFMLFATQNPAGLYGGRKALSRAFRNRFVELHFDDIPERELQQIIVDSCKVPPTHAKLLVDVYRNLTQVRAQTRIFEASHGFITLRDLFRWANRHATTKSELAEHGFMLIAERVRNDEEKAVVKRAIERAFYPKSAASEENASANAKRGIDVGGLYSESRLRQMPEFQAFQQLQGGASIAWTKAMRRLFILTALCLRFHEPVLLVGETGCGKTTVCQMLAQAKSQQLHIVNCHQNTESSDILGGQRPVRNRNALVAAAHEVLASVLGADALSDAHIETPEDLQAFVDQWQADDPDAQQTVDAHSERLEEAHQLLTRSQDLFAWHDGPLVQAMKQGDMFLMDELNLADDSVLERLNSVLEPSRTLVLAEHIGAAALVAKDGFEFVATMNPGGDYGKRELSPALRNRFTELWAPTTTDSDDLQMILDKRLFSVSDAAVCAKVILDFVAYLRDGIKVLQHPLSLRDYLFWAEFVVKTHEMMGAHSSVVHGACLVLLDSVGTQGSVFNTSTRSPTAVKAECVAKLREMVSWGASSGGYELGVVPARTLVRDTGLDLLSMVVHKDSPGPSSVGVAPFFVAEGPIEASSGGFALHAPTTFDNLVKILRAMQVGKPLLLEGSPGVGKTTLVSTLAKLAGHRLVRINLSDQTDLMDLFGTDLPVDDGFAWCDAPFLQALKQGDWVLLDEINLASQSVLEGLNSCLDHRGTVYISELDREFTLSPGFRLFAAQNPLGQGGGRKGLPRSFVNRFTQVYMDELSRDDLQIICDNMYSSHPSIERVLEFNWRMHHATMVKRLFGSSGAPWEFNLRDVSRFMELALSKSPLEPASKPIDEFIEMLYVHRMRTQQDRAHVLELYREVFGHGLVLSTPSLHITESTLQVGNAVLPRQSENAGLTRLRSLHTQLPYMESLMKCIEMRWMAILVGPAGSGKTSLVRWLANATGNKLVEFSMNSGVDTSEILGGFEQVDLQRHHSALVRKIGKLVSTAVLGCDYQLPSTQSLSQICALYQSARLCTSAQDLCALVDQISELAADSSTGSCGDLGSLVAEIRGEMQEFASLEVAGKFEWVDGVLVDALISGHWLLIDRANLCSASVLDRLNGLLEPNGVLYVNEDPKRADAIVPHENFRIMMAVDPQYGELSRAMRNRGIEICVLPAESPERRLSDQAVVAEAVGVSPALLHGEMAPSPTLTSLVQHAMHITERIQRGSVVEVDSADSPADNVVFVPDPLDSAVSVAAWQSRLMQLAGSGGDSDPAARKLRERMLLAALTTLQPDQTSLATQALQCILQSDLVSSWLTSTLDSSVLHARQALSQETGISQQLLATAPLYTPLNHSLFRVLQRHSRGPAAQWHRALADTLMFQRERRVASHFNTESGEGMREAVLQRPDLDIAGEGMREAVLQRPDLDIAYIEAVFGLVDGCDLILADWESFIASAEAVEAAIGDGTEHSDLGAFVPLMRTLFLLRTRVEWLLSLNKNTASELAVGFESMQSALSQLVDAPGNVGQRAEQLLSVARTLVLDASHSTKIWSLIHPTTLADEESRALERRLTTASSQYGDDDAMRGSITEALAILYATVSRKDRHLVLAAIRKFAESLPQPKENAEENAGVKASQPADASRTAPADIIASIDELNSWLKITNLATIAGSLQKGSSTRESLLADLQGAVGGAAVSSASSWALLFTRANWAVNEAAGRLPLSSASSAILPLLTDIAYHWYSCLTEHSPDQSLSASAKRLSLPVATALTWQQAAALDCSIDSHETVSRESCDLLRSLARFKPATRSAAAELAVLVALILQVAVTVAPEAPISFERCSEQLVDALRRSGDRDGPVDQKLVSQWCSELLCVAAPVANVVRPAAEAMARALEESTLEWAYSARVEVGMCLFAISIPKRPVDPAAKAHTQWAWLGEDVAASRADLAAYQIIQRSMTGETDTVATRPFAERLAELEAQHASIELVFRPQSAPASFAELWQEAHSLHTSVLGRARDICSRLLASDLTAESLSTVLGSVHALQGTIGQFENRVKKRYFEAFRDVAQVWCTHVQHISYGLSQLAELRRTQVSTQMREKAGLVSSLYLQPMTSVPSTRESNARLQTTLSHLKTLIYFTPESNPIKIYGELLVALLMRTTMGVQFRGVLAPADLEALDMIFRDAYEIHQRAVDEKRKRDAEAASLFKSKVTKEQTDEELLNEIFPGFEDIYDDSEEEVKQNYQDLSDDTVAAIAAHHQYVMLQFGTLSGAQDIQRAQISDAQRHAFKLAASMYGIKPDLAELQPSSMDAALRGANLLSLATVAAAAATSTSAAAAKPSGVRSVQVYNFYKDPCTSEAVSLKPLVSAIASRAEFLLEDWPDHAVLQQIRDMSRRLLGFPITTPIAKLLAGLELLYQRSQDWQTYASKEVSIDELAQVARLIIHWRQMELNSWPHLLQAQELEFARRPNEWWFNLYSSLLNQSDADFASLVGAIDQFMQGSPAGEFRGRLNMLHAFASHRSAVLHAQALQDGASVVQVKRSDSVYAPLANAIDYYLQYAPCIAEHLSRAKQAVKKDLAQYVKISTWKDVNPAALKESAQRTHKHLAKCVRQWREALSQPIFQIIQIYQTSGIAAARVPQVQIVPLPLSDAGLDVAPPKSLGSVVTSASLPWSALGLEVDDGLAAALAKLAPASMARILEASPVTLQQLHRMMQRSSAFSRHSGETAAGDKASDPIEDFALQIVSDINHFQNVETPRHLVKRPKPASSSAPKPSSKKLIIKSKKQKAQEEEEEDEYIEDDEERQRKIKQFWGEQRNLRRTRLKEILKGLQEIGLKRHFRPVADDSAEQGKAASKGSALTGQSAVLKQMPMDISAWQEAVAAVASTSQDAVHTEAPRAQRHWQLANAAFFKFTSQLTQLRTATYEDHSEEVNAQQIQHITGLMESLNHNVVRDRRSAAALLASAVEWMQSVLLWSAEPSSEEEEEEDGVSVGDLKQAVDELSSLLTQCAVGVRAISDAGGWGSDSAVVDQAAASISSVCGEVNEAAAMLSVSRAAVEAPQLVGLAERDVSSYLAALEQVSSAKKAARAATQSVRSALETIQAMKLDPALLEPWTQPILQSTACIAALLASPASGSAKEAVRSEGIPSDIAALAGQWATAVMNVWQAMSKAERQFASYGTETNMWGLGPKELVHRMELMQQLAQSLHVPKMVELSQQLAKLANAWVASSSSDSAVECRAVISRFIRPWISQYSLIVQHVLAMYADFHKTAMQFALTTSTVLTSVIVHGLGSNDIYDSEETDESMQSGTGMGEGSTAGAQNVSDEIEGEDQVEGVQGEEPDDTNEPDTNEDAIEMENDFEGKLGDADLETDDEDSDKDDDEEEDQEMDEQLGDVDLTDPTALDEKLWDDEEEDKDEKEEGKGEDNNKVDSKAKQKKDDTDIVAGDDNDEEGSSDDENNDPDKSGEQAEDGQDEDDGREQELSDASGDEEGDEGEEGEEEDEMDDRVNNDTLDRMAEVDDLGEQLEMPDDLEMDDEGDESEEDDGLDADMNDDLPEDEPIEQHPSEMNEDDAEEADNDNKDDGAEGNGADEVADDDEDVGDEDDGAEGDDNVATKDGDGSDEEEDAGENEGEDEATDDDEGQENPLADDAQDEEMEESGANKPTDGIDSAMNLDGNDDADPNTTAESENALSKPSDSSKSNNQQESSQSAAQQESFMQQPDAQDQDGSQEQEQKRNLQPERTLADVIEKWERRLNIVMREEDEEEAQDEGAEEAEQNRDPSADEERGEKAAPESSDFEHVKQDEEFDKVALADADDEDKMEQQPMDIDEEDSQQEQADDDAEMQDDNDNEKDKSAPNAPAKPSLANAQLQQPPSEPANDHSADAAQMKQSMAAEQDAETLDDAEDRDERARSEDDEKDEPAVDVDRLRDELEEATAEWRANNQDAEQAMQLWQSYTRLTHDLSLMLTEQLRLILTPTQATQLKGDYRTGKRLNMKRIIPYIASEFRKDKIWLRRTKPARREYQVMVALDNSKSMAQSPHAVELAYETLALVTTALNQLEVGQLSVVSFGEQVSLLHPFDNPFDSEAGARVLSRFTFCDDKTDVVQLMDASLRLFDAAVAAASSGSADLWRLQLVISDGVCQDHPRLLRQVRAAMEQRIMTVFIVLDRSAIATSDESVDPEKDSIMNTQHVSFVKGPSGRMEMKVERYLDTFPFKYYVVLRNINGLPAVLAETLRQYFSLVGNE
ncbi:midasin [Martensiomyces pterosporus]|nr:midasin [Martensiomyces pterosporus]